MTISVQEMTESRLLAFQLFGKGGGRVRTVLVAKIPKTLGIGG
jgi:hypothetical protein